MVHGTNLQNSFLQDLIKVYSNIRLYFENANNLSINDKVWKLSHKHKRVWQV